MSRPSIIYQLREYATAEGELHALAAIYAYLLKNRKNVEPAPEPDVRDGTLIQGADSAYEQIIREHP